VLLGKRFWAFWRGGIHIHLVREDHEDHVQAKKFSFCFLKKIPSELTSNEIVQGPMLTCSYMYMATF
jgi:hypothetical protein